MIRILLGIMVLSAVCQSGFAAIIQPSGNNSGFFESDINIGQSFKADPNVRLLERIDFKWRDENIGNPLPRFTMNLYEGEGFDGRLIDTETVAMTVSTVPRVLDFFSFDFSGNELTPGEVYTFQLIGKGGQRGGYLLSNGNPYADGAYFVDGEADPRFDMAFQVIGTVPIPPAVLLFGSGLLGLTWIARKRKTA